MQAPLAEKQLGEECFEDVFVQVRYNGRLARRAAWKENCFIKKDKGSIILIIRDNANKWFSYPWECTSEDFLTDDWFYFLPTIRDAAAIACRQEATPEQLLKMAAVEQNLNNVYKN